jgi:nucleotide-binding universal stress UspA family protein
MRIVLGFDGSESARCAAFLAGSLTWPPGAAIRVTAVIDRTPLIVPAPWAGGSPAAALELDAETTTYIEGELASIVAQLDQGDRSVEAAIHHGRPASILVDEVAAVDADLLIVGSRGQGVIRELIMGSVSSEVIEHARCPVIVARRTSVDRVVFAHDGSEEAMAAEGIIASWPMFADVPVRVVSVANVVIPWHTGIAPTMYREALASHAADVAEARDVHTQIAERSAERLRLAGREADAILRSGDPAGEIIEEAQDRDADLIVLGSRGRTGLARLLLGSVARNVVHGSEASVLVVRQAVGHPQERP